MELKYYSCLTRIFMRLLGSPTRWGTKNPYRGAAYAVRATRARLVLVGWDGALAASCGPMPMRPKSAR